MDAIDREIKQDFKIKWPVFYAFSMFAAATMVFAAVVGLTKIHEFLFSFFFLAVAVLIMVVTRLALASVLKEDSDPQTSWRVTDAGIERTYRHFRPEVIRWNQIQKMKWIPFVGLMIFWKEPRADYNRRSEWFRNELSGQARRRQARRRDGRIRTILPVQREEGNELISIAVSKTGLTAEQLRTGRGTFTHQF